MKTWEKQAMKDLKYLLREESRERIDKFCEKAGVYPYGTIDELKVMLAEILVDGILSGTPYPVEEETI